MGSSLSKFPLAAQGFWCSQVTKGLSARRSTSRHPLLRREQFAGAQRALGPGSWPDQMQGRKGISCI